MEHTNIRRRALWTAAAGVAVLGLASCGLFTGLPSRSQARIRVEAPAGVNVQVVTSIDFAPTIDQTTGQYGDALLYSADTTFATAPIDTTFDIRQTERFYAQVLGTDSSGVSVRMQIWIDNKHDYDQTQTFPGGALKYQYIFAGAG
jgi:hypothetical protein